MPPDGKTQTQGSAPPDRHAGTLAAAVRVVSGLTLLSRFAGLARDVVTARIFGDAVLGSAFRAAYALPNLFRRLFGEGALSAAFLPEYTQLRRDEPRVADELATLTIRVLTLVTGGLTLVLELVLLAILLIAPKDESRGLSLQLMMLMLPMMPMVCITAIMGGMLQAHGRFGPPAAAPIILNIFQIAAGVAFYLGWMTDKVNTAYLVGIAAVAASVVQIVWSWWALRGLVRWGRAGADAVRHGRKVLGRFVPAMLGLGTLQLNTMMDMVIAMWPVWVGPMMFGHAVSLDKSSNSILNYTQSLYQFPLGVFGLAVATAVFPMLSRATNDPAEFAMVLRRGLRLSLFIGLPATAGLMLVRHDLVYVIFSGGKSGFSADGVERAAAVLMGFSPGVWAYSLNHVLTRAFYAKHDTHTPMRVAVAMVGLNLTLNLVLMWPLREAGLAWATAIASFAQLTCLMVLCRTRLHVAPMDRETILAFARIALAVIVMSLGVWATMHYWPAAERWWPRLVRLAASVLAGAVTFAVAAAVMRMPEVRWLMARGGRGGGGDAMGGMSFE
ncbi:MAG: murein biosynthesis integral membrane protein MurJ [Planctomycetes bacterium]|nr:murein biosynthesis integral membrane protein MurJ [Planctomycetota bacterium]